MMQLQVVVLADHSLFAEGVASRLREYPQRINLHFIDFQQSDYLSQVNASQPAVVVIDGANIDETQSCLLCELLTSLSDVIIVLLETHKNDIQIISSVFYPLNAVSDILAIVEQAHRVQALTGSGNN